ALLDHIALGKAGGEDVAPNQTFDLIGFGRLDGAVLAVDVGNAAAGRRHLDVGALGRCVAGAHLHHPHPDAHHGGAYDHEDRPSAPEEVLFPARRSALRAVPVLLWLCLEHFCPSLSIVPGTPAGLPDVSSIAGIS